MRLHRAGDKIGAARSFEMWCKATVQGQLQTLPGLLARRQREAAYYLTPDAPAVKAMPQAVEEPARISKTAVAGGISVAAGAASVADQVNSISPVIEAISTSGQHLQSILRLGALALSIIAVAAVVYMLVRYLHKRSTGQVVST